MPPIIHLCYHQIFKIWRRKRRWLFVKIIKPTQTDIVLDVGGYPWLWLSQSSLVKRVDVLNVQKTSWTEKISNVNIQAIVGDGCALPLPDKSYDVGFSNSVIEHVGSWERQQQFASEIRRVAKALWVQTPAYGCPIEPHYLAPFVHYLPKDMQRKILQWISPRVWLDDLGCEQINQMVDTTRLLRKKEVKQLFPDCQILTERLLWIIPKSYIAVRLK